MILANTYPYTGNGLGGLPDAIECVVSHEINGIYELAMKYPVTGLHFDELVNGRIIMAAPDGLTAEQPFRIYRITKPLNGIVSVYARHLCYDMQGIVVEPFTATSLTEAVTNLPSHLTPANSFNIQTSRTVASGMKIEEPRPLWKLIGGQSGSFLDVYGGEWDFDGYDATLVTKLGTDRGVSIRYGKNMTQLEQDGSIEGAYSDVYPYWWDEESGTLVTITEKYVPVAGAIVTDRVFVLDCSGDFDTEPTEQDLRDRANAYISAHSLGSASVSWKISFQDDPTLPSERVMLGDTLHVYYERLDVNATARAVKVEWDVLADRYKSITVGKVKQNLAQIIVNNQKETESQFEGIKSALETAVDDATDFIRNGAGYMRFIYNSSNELTEIVSLDDPDILQASSVWRWNNGGFGHSSTGYNGTYDLAITQNGAIVADFITAGTLNANVIRAGILQDALGKNSWNLETGAFNITNGSIQISTTSSTYDYIRLSYKDNSDNYFTTALSSTNLRVDYIPNGSSVPTNSASIGIGGLYAGVFSQYDPDTQIWTSVGKAEYLGDHLSYYRNFERDKWLDITATQLTYYDSNSTTRVKIAGYNGELYLYDVGGTNRTKINGNGEISLYDSSGTLRTKIDGEGKLWQYGTTGVMRTYLGYGDIYFYDSSGNMITNVDNNGMRCYNSGGTLQTSYPSTLPSPSGGVSGYSTRSTINFGGAWTVGGTVFINVSINSSHSATNTPRMATCNFLSQYEVPLLCFDATDRAVIPAYMTANGNIYIKTTVSGHNYELMGVFPQSLT